MYAPLPLVTKDEYTCRQKSTLGTPRAVASSCASVASRVTNQPERSTPTRPPPSAVSAAVFARSAAQSSDVPSSTTSQMPHRVVKEYSKNDCVADMSATETPSVVEKVGSNAPRGHR